MAKDPGPKEAAELFKTEAWEGSELRIWGFWFLGRAGGGLGLRA